MSEPVTLPLKQVPKTGPLELPYGAQTDEQLQAAAFRQITRRDDAIKHLNQIIEILNSRAANGETNDD